MNASIFLTDIEIAEIAKPLTQPAAQCRYLERLGLKVQKKPNGKPLVTRSNVEAVLGSVAPAPAAKDARHEPNRAGLIATFAQHKRRQKTK